MLQGKPEITWETRVIRDPAALVLSAGAVLVTGREAATADRNTDSHVLAALDRTDGRQLWSLPLPGAPARWGMAVDSLGRILVTLDDGRVVCFVGVGGRER